MAATALIEPAEADGQDALDDCIEAQVHGPVVLAGHPRALKKVWHCLARFGTPHG
ncbi:hypothetical protein [Kitasatospora indigofera]|uniref:hypothetical protein n=1 Tax=Kitasatospora indigofera TaxID=67307 RepID=UPI00367D6CCD